MHNLRSNSIQDIYPLSPMQQGMLFHTLYEPESAIYFEQSNCRLKGKLDVSAFELAWQRILDSHPVLRTSFVWEGLDDPVQVVNRQVQLPLTQQDWRGLSQVEQHEQLQRFLSADRKEGFAISQAPLMRLALIRLTDYNHEFIWSFHHLLLDGWSAALLWRDVAAFYQAFCRGAEPRLEPTRLYRDYIAWLQQQDLALAKQYWEQTLQGFTAPTPLSVDKVAYHSSKQSEICDEQQIRLSTSTTSALQFLAQEQRLTLNTIVQGAWALLLSHYSGENDVVFGVTVSGRPADLPEVETMVGLFINTLPLRVGVSPEARILPWLKWIQVRQVEMRQ